MMIPQHTQPPCRCCGNDRDDCICPLCPVCECAGDTDCYIPSSDEFHGGVFSLDQLFGQGRILLAELQRTLANDESVVIIDGLVSVLKRCLPIVDAYRSSTDGDGDLAALAARDMLERLEKIK